MPQFMGQFNPISHMLTINLHSLGLIMFFPWLLDCLLSSCRLSTAAHICWYHNTYVCVSVGFVPGGGGGVYVT